MPRIELPPTKSSLRRLKEDLVFAYEGYDLLNQKREILAFEIVRYIGMLRKMEPGFKTDLDGLYSTYKNAALDMGSDALILKSASENRRYFLKTKFTRLMGLKLPDISLSSKKSRARLPGTTASYDTAKEQSIRTIEKLALYAGITKSIIILSRELRKVQRRINALEKIFIPQHEKTKKYIADRLEEMDREEIFVKKLIRQRTQTEELQA